MNSGQYRMKFGQHKGKRLDELDASYRSWLINDRVYEGKEDLKAALIQGHYLDPNITLLTPPSTPSRKRNVSQVDTAATPSSAKKFAISKAAKINGTMLNYDGTAYIFDFGKHGGQKLNEVPPDYIAWLIKERVHEKKPDLAAALHEGGFLSDSPTTEIGDLSWTAPDVNTTTDKRFTDPDTGCPRWISDSDAKSFFRLSEPQLSRAGVPLVPQVELKQYSEFPELAAHTKGPRRWLLLVYECARQLGSLVTDHCDDDTDRGNMVDVALMDFLEKNRRREGKIWL